MKVIAAGYSKTGTKTMCLALSMLGYNVYDYMENSYYLHKDWVRIFEDGVKPGDFKRMYKGVDAVTDTPCFYYWEEMTKDFPDAKIILMVRDEDSWYKSLLKQADELSNSWMRWILQTFTLHGFSRIEYRYNVLKFMGDVSPWPKCKLITHNQTVMKRMYREHNLYVQTVAPKDKLLVYKISDGWKPLCDFLGVEIPNKPFPHKNKGGVLLEEMKKTDKTLREIEKEFKVTLLIASVLLAVFVYVLYKCAYF